MFFRSVLKFNYQPSIKFPSRLPSTSVNLTNREALNLAISEELDRDDSVCLLGHKVSLPTDEFRVTQGLFKRFGEERVKDLPQSESAFTGMACGAALMGMKPIV